MASWKLTLAYDGTDFQGWQVQAEGARTVQGALEAALAELAGGPVRVSGAGRTDAGVHAEGQVASLELTTRLDAATLQRALNAMLPPDAAVIRAEPAPPGFHARYDARAKFYRYEVWNGRVRAPLEARYRHHVNGPLDLAAMARACQGLVGTHDFASFQAAGTAVKTTVRTLHTLGVRGVPGGRLVFEAVGSGFLRHMVRNLVGTLLEVGRGRLAPGAPAAILAARDRAAAGPTAPARGLVLVRVDYGFRRKVEDLGLEVA